MDDTLNFQKERQKREYATTKARMEASDICEENKKLILALDDLISEKTSIRRRAKYIRECHRLAAWLGKPLSDATKDDKKRVLAKIEEYPSMNTIYDFKQRWNRLRRETLGLSDDPLKMKLPSKSQRLNKPEKSEIFSEAEMRKVIDAAGTLRDKLLILMSYELGTRPEELLSLRIKDLEFDDRGCMVRVRGTKTAHSDRKIRIFMALPMLRGYLKGMKCTPESYLWKSNKRPYRLGYGGFVRVWRKALEESGIKKDKKLYVMRKSRLTKWCELGLGDQQVYYLAGQKPGSEELQVYLRRSSKIADDSLTKAQGYEVNEKDEKSPLAPNKCQVCGYLNNYDAGGCGSCGANITIEERAKISDAQEILEIMGKMPEYDALAKKAIEIWKGKN